jgi:hypothetical protein
MAHVFNSDLLLHEADRAAAQQQFPNVYFALTNEPLLDLFRPIDERANLSKARSRRWGVYAVLLATAALMLAAGEMLYADLPKNQVRVIALVGGIAGIAAIVIGISGIMFHERKMRWLSDRLSTERLRQFQFQSYVGNPAGILAGAKDKGARERFLTARAARFEAFSKQLLAQIDDEVVRLARSDDVGDGMIFGDEEQAVDPADPHLAEYFAAYEKLRFGCQIGYFDHVLGKDLWRHAPGRQARLIAAVAIACVAAILVLHGLVFMGVVADVGWMKGPWIHVFAIWAAIIALTARIFEQGFQPDREVERMRRHRYAVKRIQALFDGAKNPAAKIAAMRDLEQVTYHEMVHFLKSNYEAQFVM